MKPIELSKCHLGMEFGSTRIKAVLIDETHAPVASGSHQWENRLENGFWTYGEGEILSGMQACFASLKEDVKARCGVPLTTVGGMGVSAMMHGYLALDQNGALLTPFRTWRNTNTGEAAERLTDLFGFAIPQRWSVAHLYQAMLTGEAHVPHIARLTTLAGYVHALLTGESVLGVGDASGMFPIGADGKDYDAAMLRAFDALSEKEGMPWRLYDLLPRVLQVGEDAGVLSAEGARLIDPSGELLPGVPLCPPEGDAGTGMAATNSVLPGTGNVSAGTSIFAMIVLEKPLQKLHRQIDLVTTPSGAPVAMVHCNNCTGELDAWAGLISEAARRLGAEVSNDRLYRALFAASLDAPPDAEGLLAYNYFGGEPVTGLDAGRPLFVRRPDTRLMLSAFMRAQIYGALATLRIGMDVLSEEQVALRRVTGHGGFFKAGAAAQRALAAALNAPVTVLSTAGEGGPWGMALLSAYRGGHAEGETLAEYLAAHVFKQSAGETVQPDPLETAGFDAFMERYRAGLTVERAAVENI